MHRCSSHLLFYLEKEGIKWEKDRVCQGLSTDSTRDETVEYFSIHWQIWDTYIYTSPETHSENIKRLSTVTFEIKNKIKDEQFCF